MDVGNTIRKARTEYKEYLQEKYPEWKEVTVNTHTSDAFYLWNNTLVVSFWGCLVDDTSMTIAKEAIYNNVKKATPNTVETRTKEYFSDLTKLKTFLDTVHGGVKNYVGYEYDCEKIIYKYAKQVYEGEMFVGQAVETLIQEVPCCSAEQHKLAIDMFASMMDGQQCSRRNNIGIIIFFISQIAKDYGIEKLTNALMVVKDSIQYNYKIKGQKAPALCRECQTIAEEYGIDIAFDDSLFEEITPKKGANDILGDKTDVQYWLYAAGEQSCNWEKDYAEGVMAIGWSALGDLTNYKSKEDMKKRMKVEYGKDKSYKNQGHATWEFANKIRVGDIIFVKKGISQIVGRGVVEGDYVHDVSRGEYCNIRNVRWTHKGEWNVSRDMVVKVLTNMTPYPVRVDEINSFFPDEPKKEIIYTPEHFLEEVYMSKNDYQTLCELIMTKKNVILQGAPGVGKTFVAKRLAYSIMKVMDKKRVQMVQFHQSYSYEDFVMGYRPKDNGFELKTGSFYDFCREAEKDDEDTKYFFIIDEINRGNLSKIFGELFMLIESDKRDIELQLLYQDKDKDEEIHRPFAVPKNVHIIGMMNTADRSLAMMDYALRRRFSFFEMDPAFDSDGFKKYQTAVNNDKFNKLIEAVKKLNETIATDDSLGEGFRIGHSYFCREKVEDVTELWLKSVVEYDLIPLLKEYWFDEPAKVEAESENLREAIR